MLYRGVKSGYVVEIGFAGPLFQMLEAEGIIKRVVEPVVKLKPNTQWGLMTSPQSGELWITGHCLSCNATHRLTARDGDARGFTPFAHCGVLETAPIEIIKEFQARYRVPEPH